MKNPLSFFTRKNLETSVGVLQERFPLPSLIVLVVAGLLFYMVNTESESILLVRTIFSLIVTFALSIGTSLFLESATVKSKKLWHLTPLVYGVLFFVSINPMTHEWIFDSVIFFVLHLVGFLMLLFFAPYVTDIFHKKEQTVEYTNYFSWVAWTLLMTGIVGGALIALGFVAIASVMALFDLSTLVQENKLYGNWAVMALSLIASLYCLIHLPRSRDIEKRHYDVNRFFSFLIRYIATPFIVLYFIILYAYSAKVLLNFQDWPKGMISWMVIGFSSFGYLTYIFSKSYEDESKIVAVFRKYFPSVVPAQILMLAYAIYLRIAQYDLTMNRYFVVIFGASLAIISAYYILSSKKSLSVIAASLTVITLIISVGPWSVYRLPAIRQYNHLVSNLQTANMMKEGVIVKKKNQLDVALENDIYSEIQYLCDFSRCEQIKTLFAAQLADKEAKYEKIWHENDYNEGKEYPGMSRWDIVNEIATELEISYRYSGETVGRKYISFGIRDNRESYDES